MSTPLAEKLRPKELSEVVGQKHLLGKGKPITVLLEKGNLVSLIFWGPPGTGKTTIAKLLADQTNSEFISFSAVGGSVKELREIIAMALSRRDLFQKQTIVFIDELHRFNKAQQDSLLHAVEEGIITMIGATTENPSFYINAPLLSRSRVFKLDSLSEDDLEILLERVDKLYPETKFEKKAKEYIIQQSHGDARSLLNTLELLLSLTNKITLKEVENALQKQSIY
ncbi:MAG TPA: AAA family ATPase, partial [Candidatus Woesebacteria bacterium]|nr:AAA family ATPase [Candidatus Woesebacteria bacterium]